jgi:hypothetical protein
VAWGIDSIALGDNAVASLAPGHRHRRNAQAGRLWYRQHRFGVNPMVGN